MENTELEIKTIDTENGKVFILNRNIEGITDTYEIVLVTETFKKQETKLLVNEIERYLKKLYKSKGVNINGTDKKSLKMAFNELQAKGYEIEIVDRYKNLQHEEIIGAYNGMTIIQEESTLSCAMEIRVYGKGNT